MNKKISLTLYKSLLYCDFFLLRSDFCKLVSSEKKFLSHFKLYSTINLLESLKNIKRLISILRFIIKRNFNKIIIKLENLLFFNFICTFFKCYPIIKNFLFFTSKLQGTIFKPMTHNYFYCFLGNSNLLKNEQVQKVSDNDIHLISTIKLNQNTQEQGIYKVITDFIDFKKIIFFTMLLNKIINYYRNIFTY